MKILASAVALSILVAVPTTGEAAVKKKKDQARPTSHRTVVQPRLQPRTVVRRMRSPTPQWDVYRDNGEYAGTDPDPRIRAMLRRDDPNADP